MLKYLLLSFSLALSLQSCREVVQSGFPEMEALPVINAILVAGENVHVNLSLAASLDSSKIPWVDNAVVAFFENDSFLENLEYAGQGLYTGNSVVQQNTGYRCEIEIPGKGLFSCSTHVPLQERIKSIKLTEQAVKDAEGYTYPSVEVVFTNSLKNRMFYDIQIKLFEHGEASPAWIKDHTDPVLLNEGLPLATFSNDLITDTVYSMDINFFTGSTGSDNYGPISTRLYPFIVELRTVDASYYHYYKQLYLYYTGRYPEFSFSGTAAYPLYSNIENAYGVFTSYAVSVSDTIYPSTYER
jgi:hypothetical protein